MFLEFYPILGLLITGYTCAITTFTTHTTHQLILTHTTNLLTTYLANMIKYYGK